jgi:SAM-dependent methyltransferase
MDRQNWLRTVRREIEERYDTLWASQYGEKWGTYGNASHRHFLDRFMGFLPEHSTVLDAACGAGRYMGTLLEKGHKVVGIDQSQGMLDRVKERFPAVHVEKVGLQEMAYDAAFDGAICVDAMEHVFPEDWPGVLSNLRRALKPEGYLYFTVEMAAASEIEDAFMRGQVLGLPIAYGESADEDVYHYHPPLQRVRKWVREAELIVIDEGEGDSYRHFLVRKSPVALPEQGP